MALTTEHFVAAANYPKLYVLLFRHCWPPNPIEDLSHVRHTALWLRVGMGMDSQETCLGVWFCEILLRNFFLN